MVQSGCFLRHENNVFEHVKTLKNIKKSVSAFMIRRYALFEMVRVVIQHFLKTIVVQFVFEVIG